LTLDCVRAINLGNPEKHDMNRIMADIMAHGKAYFGSFPRPAGEPLKEYFSRIIDSLGGSRKGLILILPREDQGDDDAREAVCVWHDLTAAI